MTQCSDMMRTLSYVCKAVLPAVLLLGHDLALHLSGMVKFRNHLMPKAACLARENSQHASERPCGALDVQVHDPRGGKIRKTKCDVPSNILTPASAQCQAAKGVVLAVSCIGI